MSSSEIIMSPLMMASEFLKSREWKVEKVADGEIATEITDFMIPLQMSVLWQEDQQSLMVSCNINQGIEGKKKNGVSDLIISINPRIWMGHFEIDPHDDTLGYRYTLSLAGMKQPTSEQLETMVDTALAECVRIYPALQFILVEGKAANDAAMAALFDTAGEA